MMSLNLAALVAQPAERTLDRHVDDLEHAAANELLVLDQRDVGSMPVVSQSIMNAIVPVGARTVACELRNPLALAERERIVPHPSCLAQEIERHERRLDLVSGGAMLGDHPLHRLGIGGIPGEGPHLAGDPCRLEIGLAAHEARSRHRRTCRPASES